MNIHTEKLHLMKLILETENTKILESIRTLFIKERKADFWDSLTKDQKHDIELGIAEIENGNTVEYESMIREHRK
jgi:hypothetical protein